MTLDLYLARRFAFSFLRVFGIFLGVLMLIDLIEQIRRFSDVDIALSQAFVLALLNVPQNLYGILPLLMVLAAIMLFLSLAKSSELVGTRRRAGGVALSSGAGCDGAGDRAFCRCRLQSFGGSNLERI